MNSKILRINLSEGTVKEEKIKGDVLKKFLGGKGLGYYLIYREVPPNVSPLDERNKIIFAAGLFSGIVPGGSKVSVVSRSPETGLISDSYAGDRFGPLLKRWGYDALIFEGKSEKPVYFVLGENTGLERAEKLWGVGVYRATKILWERYDGAVATIGPAGEREVRIASIIFDTERAAGRGGLGAVKSSKNLKAIVIEKTDRKIEIRNEDEYQKLRDVFFEKYSQSEETESLRKYGTTNGLLSSSRVGMSPSYNFSKPYIPEELAEKLSYREIGKYEVEPEEFIHGKSCPVKCARYVKIKINGKEIHVKPEYESLAMLGAATGVFNAKKVLYFIHLANDLGLDSISAGNVIAWLFEMVEKGLITENEIGFKVRGFGDEEAEERLLEMIAMRHGIGAVLAEGVKRASEILNRGSELAVHVKGLEAPAWDPRGLRTYALSYATADVGASHLRGWPSPRSLPNDGPAKDLVPSLISSRDKDALFDSLGVCKFVPYEVEDLQRFCNPVFGETCKFNNVGWRIETIARIYDILAGLIPDRDDVIPYKWWMPEEEGPAKGNRAFIDRNDFLEAKKEFYRLRGWDDELGTPLPQTIEVLELSEFKNDAILAIEMLKRKE